jgi:hypothetical protein
MCVCVCVCVSSESNRISEIAICKPSTRQSRPRSVRSATQTWKEVNLWLCLIKLDILKRKKEMAVKLHAILNCALVRVCANLQIPAVLWTWWPSVRLNMAAKRTFPILSRNGTHYNYMVIYDCCSSCGQNCTHLTAPHVQTLWQLYFSQSSTENERLRLQIGWLSISPYARQCAVGTDIYTAGILSGTIMNIELEIVLRSVRNTAKSD